MVKVELVNRQSKKRKGRPISTVIVEIKKTGKRYVGKLYKRKNGTWVVNVMRSARVAD